eukprot:TRINITY_DN3135_c0_g1_i2.p1 TRINITY_DN3135_c0_g1~~TRINITY_DN3135_c0_g1_i2.p1  ORF type:complete len:536 (+),score=158.16 TRINITY_DN3135_c0_g1_i2:43-1608(+)
MESTSFARYDDEEKISYINFINSALQEVTEVADRVPIDTVGDDVFTVVSDGILLSHLINVTIPDAIDIRAVIQKPKMNPYESASNLRLVIGSMKGLGCSLVGTDEQAVFNGEKVPILALLWQILKSALASKITIKKVPELSLLLKDEEEFSDILNLNIDELLIRWINYFVSKYDSSRVIDNASTSLKDGTVLAILIYHLCENKFDLELVLNMEIEERFAYIWGILDSELGLKVWISFKMIMKGHSRLCLALLAQIFNYNHGLVLSKEEEADLMAFLEGFNFEGTREQRSYSSWITGLGIETPVNNLLEDLKSGVILCEMCDKMFPGSIDMKRVDRKPRMKFHALGNIRIALDTIDNAGIRLVGVHAQDISSGDESCIIQLVYVLMRHSVSQFLREVMGGKEITDRMILKIVNDKVKNAGKSTEIRSFGDKSIADGLFLLDLIEACFPKSVKREIVTAGQTEEEKEMNAKYIISLARRECGSIFCSYEDIVDVKSKMIMTLVTAIIAEDLKQDQQHQQQQDE